MKHRCDRFPSHFIANASKSSIREVAALSRAFKIVLGKTCLLKVFLSVKLSKPMLEVGCFSILAKYQNRLVILNIFMCKW